MQIPGMVINPGFFSGGRNPGTAPSLGQLTWATLPSAVLYPYSTALITDTGVQPFTVVSDGTRWVPEGPQVLAQSGVAVAVPADVTEDTLATINIPAGLLGPSAILTLDTLWTFTNSVNNKTMKVHYTGVGGTAIMSIVQTTQNGGVNLLSAVVQGRGATNSQITSSRSTGNLTNITATAVDTTAATTLVITGQKALAGETLQLESYCAIVMP